jgi:CRISPR-associated endonuclease/helicase Cas3
MKTVEEYLKEAIRVADCLANERAYLAHIPSPAVGGQTETLAEHLDLVFKYFSKLVSENRLDKTIDSLKRNLVSEVVSQKKEVIEEHVKRLFVDTVVFHDFGKVNENFQADRMLNPLFKNVATPIKPAHGHSELGAFIYCVYQVERLKKLALSDDEVNFLAAVGFILVNSINLHHSPELVEPFSRLAKSVFIEQHPLLTKYLDLYGFEQPILTASYFENLDGALASTSFSASQSFSLYTLARLNFSLLTAADYLATSEYMSGQEVNDLGLFSDSLRKRVIDAAKFSKAYNTEAYELIDANHSVSNPTERNGNNLNTLRQNMAVEVIRTVRQNIYERLFYLEAPTGGGKTNLSMLAVAELLKAHSEINKVFYVFPFTTLITQTHQAIIDTFGLSGNEISLLHSKAGFQTTAEDDDYGGKRLDYLNNLFVHYPFCLLTHIRFFDILKTNEKETNYLLHRLTNSIVVIDELQSYPPQHWDKMLYFIRQFAEPFNVRFILMSATLPRIDKLNLPLTNRTIFTDLLPKAKEYFTNPNFCDRVRFRFDYRNQRLEMDELAQIVLQKSKAYIEKHHQGGVFTIIEFIFKKSATEFSEAIGESFFDTVFVLSGTILEPRRKEIINFLKNINNRNKKVLLITTQVVEAGVDIDMDLGFKNVSLIDSDEQLAGRVNRNVLKEPCEVYLFQINQPSQLYKQDERYIITRDFLSTEEHEEILKTKDFEKLYNLVLAKIDKLNSIKDLQNFTSDYLPEITSFNYRQVHQKFKLINQTNLSVFVPLHLPKRILSHNGEPEEVFSKSELAFLLAFGIETKEDCINGTEVWKVYKAVLFNQSKNFSERQIDKKIISGILSKFTFSMFANEKIKRSLKVNFGFPSTDRENELRGFDNYIYLAHYNDCYDYEKGLLETKFDTSEAFIL